MVFVIYVIGLELIQVVLIARYILLKHIRSSQNMGAAMKRIILTAMVAVFFLTGLAYPGESYLCIKDKAAGFEYNKKLKEWVSVNFESDKKYVVSRSKIKGKTWEVKELGSDYLLSYSEADFNAAGILFCDGIYEFIMNKINLRYIITYNIGYYYAGEGMPVSDDKSATPFVEIGKCSPRE